MRGLLGRRVEEFAKKTATAVRLEDLYRWGNSNMITRLRFARFLHREVAIRNAQLCKELQVLPFGLPETRGVSDVISCFSSYTDTLAESPRPKSADDDSRFIQLLRDILEDNVGIVGTLGRGVRELQEALGEERYEDIRAEVDLIFDRFFMKQIGLRFLLQHYIESAESRPGVSGIIHDRVHVGRILRREAHEARRLCLQLYGEAPEIVVIGDGHTSQGWQVSQAQPFCSLAGLDLCHDRQFTYVPLHLQFSCSVLLQNACFSVAELRKTRPEKQEPMPVVQAIFAHGEEEVAVKVSDEGGGIPRSKSHLSWSYFCAPDSGGDSSPKKAWRHSAPLGAGNPCGAGLPLARLHAQYYGGNLILKSIDGFGTDAYLFLKRLGQNCENLPHGVRVSPAMRDSSYGREALTIESLGDLAQPEIYFLRRRLAEFRKENANSVAKLSSASTSEKDNPAKQMVRQT